MIDNEELKAELDRVLQSLRKGECHSFTNVRLTLGEEIGSPVIDEDEGFCN